MSQKSEQPIRTPELIHSYRTKATYYTGNNGQSSAVKWRKLLSSIPSTRKPDRGGFTFINSVCQRLRQEDQKVKVILGYIAHLRPIWAPWDPALINLISKTIRRNSLTIVSCVLPFSPFLMNTFIHYNYDTHQGHPSVSQLGAIDLLENSQDLNTHCTDSVYCLLGVSSTAYPHCQGRLL